MKAYGKQSLITYSCGCCTEKTEHRSKSKSELRKLIQEENAEVVYLGHTVPKSETSDYCPVCGDYKNESCVTEC
jgi:hypothetical protein